MFLKSQALPEKFFAFTSVSLSTCLVFLAAFGVRWLGTLDTRSTVTLSKSSLRWIVTVRQLEDSTGNVPAT